jgi:hypothetical protein
VSEEEAYFSIAIYSFYIFRMSEGEGRAFTEGDVSDYVQSYYFGSSKFSPTFFHSQKYLSGALKVLAGCGVVYHLPDKFAGDYYIPNESIEVFDRELERLSAPYKTYNKLGKSAGIWLSKALVAIEKQAQPTLLEQKGDAVEVGEDWSPLPLDATQPEIAEAIGGIEEALGRIHADNGLAANFPAERDSLIEHAQATLSAAKAGTVGKAQVRQNVVSAGKWLMDKFGGSALGALGGELVKWGLRLLGLL